MKRTMRWCANEEEDDSLSDNESSLDEGDGEHGKSKVRKRSNDGELSSEKSSEAKSAKKKGAGIDFEALRQHGYKGGLSVLSVPPPREAEKPDWSWSTGKEKAAEREVEESNEERQKTRAAMANAEQLQTAVTRTDKKNISFQQKEKRKRDLGQASRGKNYVEEEKRLLRDSGIYSGFDS
ncbi:hypothetical protein Ancab_020047 [Ancistrocladus abbreviatus]